MEGTGTLQTTALARAASVPSVQTESPAPKKLANKNVAFFAQDIADASTIKRSQQLIAHGFTVTVFGFRRQRYNIDFKPTWPHVLLGYTQDRNYLRRLKSLIGAIPLFWTERRAIAHSSVFYARNLDQLALALLVRLFINPRATVIYEVLDIQPILAGTGPLCRMLRLIERVCLTQVRYLVLSSPGFFRNYYFPIQKYQGAWLLVENKLTEPLPEPRPSIDERRARSPNRWRVGYFGLIRGQRTFDLIVRLAERLGDKVEFHFAGVLTTVDEARFHAALASHSNIVYEGRYEIPRDLPKLYRSVDFAWALDLENVDHNSRWLLPCRLYEAGYFGVPCLAVHDFELGNHVDRAGVGWSFVEPLEEALVHFFETLTPELYDEKRRRLLAQPESAFVSGADIDALSRVVEHPDWAFSVS